MKLRNICACLLLISPLTFAYFWSEQNEQLEIQKQLSPKKPLPSKKQPFPQKNSKQLIATGDAFCNQGDLARAIAYYKKALKKSRRSPQAHLHLGLALAMQGNFSQAVATVTNLSSANPTYFRSFCTLGFLTYHTTLMQVKKQKIVQNKAVLQQIIARYLKQL